MMSPEPVIRKFVNTDAEGVAELFREVYGHSYPLTCYYHPAELIGKAARGEIRSVVAVIDRKVVGHVDMNFTPSLGIPERGQSVVSPSCRGTGLFRRMLDFLHSTARGAGIAGLYNEAVTTHPFSQKGSISAGARECGLQLNYVPGEVECGIGESSSSRKAVVVLYVNLQKDPVSRVFMPPRDEEIITLIFSHLGISLQSPVAPGGKPARATLLSTALSVINTGLITVHTYGEDFRGSLERSLGDLAGKGASTVILDLPMGNGYLLEAVSGAEELGFGFSGVIPRYYRDDDCLRMQYLSRGIPVHWDELVLATDFARALADHVRKRLGERGR